MVFQNYALYPHMTVFDNIGFALKLAKVPKNADQRAGAQGGGNPRARAVAGPQAGPVVGWSAPAGGDGSGHRASAQGVLDGRAVVQPRRQAACADACRDRQLAAQPRCHHRVRHPRPGRGDDDGRPCRRAQGRLPATGRHAAEPLRPPDQRVRRRVHRVTLDEPVRGQRDGQRRRRHGRGRQPDRRLRPRGADEVPEPRQYSAASGSSSASAQRTSRTPPSPPMLRPTAACVAPPSSSRPSARS